MTGSSENFDRFIGPLLSRRTAEAAIRLSFYGAVLFRGDIMWLLICIPLRIGWSIIGLLVTTSFFFQLEVAFPPTDFRDSNREPLSN